MILKTEAYVSRGTILETFLKQQNMYESFCYLNEKIGFLARKFYAGLPQANFTCPEQHFEKNMIEVNFSVCGFFKSLRDFFFTDKKLAVGVKTTTQAYRAKIYRKIFCRKGFSKVFHVLSRGTWNLSGKLLAESSKPHSMGLEEHVHSNIFEVSLKTFQLFRIITQVSVTTAKN